MKTEENNRMEALACIIADLKAENMMMTERVHQFMDENNDFARQLIGKKKRKDVRPAMLTVEEVQQIYARCDELEKDLKKKESFTEALFSFVNDKNLYLKNGTKCPFLQDSPKISPFKCMECDLYVDDFCGLGVICKKRLADTEVSFPKR